MSLRFADVDPDAIDLHVLSQDTVEGWLADQPPAVAAWVGANGFTGSIGEALVIAGADGLPMMALAGYGTPQSRARGRFALASAAAKLPSGTRPLNRWPQN